MLSDWLVPPNIRFGVRSLLGRERRAEARSFFRSFVNWTVPANIQKTLLGAIYSLRGLSVKENARLKNRHVGRRCFVIGNGPSLKKLDLSPLADEITIGANSFYKHPDAEKVDLKYLCIGDENFMLDEPRSIEWHRIIEEKLPSASFFFIPESALSSRSMVCIGTAMSTSSGAESCPAIQSSSISI